MIVLIINWHNFVYLLHLYETSRFVPLIIGWTPLTDTQRRNGHRDKRTCLSVRLCLRWILTQTVNVDVVRNSRGKCCLFDHCDGRNATSQVCWLTTCTCWSRDGYDAVDGRRGVAGELKDAGQRLLTACTGGRRPFVDTYIYSCTLVLGWALGQLKSSARGVRASLWKLLALWCAISLAKMRTYR